MQVLSIGIVRDCFYLLIFLRNSQLESDVCRFAVNLNLNLSHVLFHTAIRAKFAFSY